MTTKPPTDIMSQFPQPLVRATVEAAGSDAEFVAGFLDEIERRREKDPGNPRFEYSAAFLLALGAALRTFYWEGVGIHIHTEMGLPKGKDAILRLFEWYKSESPEVADGLAKKYCVAVIQLQSEQLAWDGNSLLSAPIVIGMPEQEALLDAMAAALWESRHQNNVP